MIGFGENDLYDQADNEHGSWLYALQVRLKEILGFTVPFFFGRGLLHRSLGLMPFMRPLNVVGTSPASARVSHAVGKPIPVKHTAKPTDAELEETQRLYIESLVACVLTRALPLTPVYGMSTKIFTHPRAWRISVSSANVSPCIVVYPGMPCSASTSSFMQENRAYALLTLVRHAESRANVERVLQGVTDAPLSGLGEQQLQLLETAWRHDDHGVNALALPPPTLLVSSPIGRARKTAGAIARGASIAEPREDDAISHRSPSAQPPPRSADRYDAAMIDPALCERNFGMAEGTRKGKYIDGFPRPVRGKIGPSESHADMELRCDRTGSTWIDWLWAVARRKGVAARSAVDGAVDSGSGDATDETPDSAGGETPDGTEDETPDSTEDGDLRPTNTPTNARPRAAAACADGASDTHAAQIPHLVLVSHGMWIKSFLSMKLREFAGQNAFAIRTDNTAAYTIALHDDGSGRPALRLLRANDTRHLGASAPSAGQKRPRAAQTTTLTKLWRAPAK